MSEVLDTPGTGLTVIPASAASTIVTADTNDILGKLAAKVAAHQPDVSTSKGRREIASLAADVASSKMDLIRLGKGLTETWRKSTSAVNSECKIIEERLDALKVQVRAPLAEFEGREARRVQAHEDALSNMQEIACVCDDCAVLLANVEAAYGHLSAAHARDWEEFSHRAERTYRDALGKLDTCKATVLARDAAAAEAARVEVERVEAARQEAARIQAEREARIAEQAAAQAKAAAEAEAERQRHAEQRQVDAERLQAQQERAAAIQQAEVQRQREEQARLAAEERASAAERERILAEERREAAARQAEADRTLAAQQAERSRIAAAEQAERDQAAAVRAEQERVAAATKAEQADADRRAADKAHRSKINRAAADALALSGVTPEQAVAIVTAIARGEVPRIAISY